MFNYSDIIPKIMLCRNYILRGYCFINYKDLETERSMLHSENAIHMQSFQLGTEVIRNEKLKLHKKSYIAT